MTAAAKTTSALEMLERKERQIKERQQQARAALKQCGETDAANVAALQQQQQQHAAATADLQSLKQQKQEIETRTLQLEQQFLDVKSQLMRVLCSTISKGLGFRVQGLGFVYYKGVSLEEQRLCMHAALSVVSEEIK